MPALRAGHPPIIFGDKEVAWTSQVLVFEDREELRTGPIAEGLAAVIRLHEAEALWTFCIVPPVKFGRWWTALCASRYDTTIGLPACTPVVSDWFF